MEEMNERIRYLYAKFLTNTLSGKEIPEFKEWMEMDPKHKEFCTQSVELLLVDEQLKSLKQMDKAALWRELRRKQLERKTRRRQLFTWSAAASVAILVGLASLLGIFDRGDKAAYSELYERKGSRQAFLSMENGVEMKLPDTDSILDFGFYQIHILDGTFNIQQIKGNTGNVQLAYNTVNVPLGAEYKVVLPDGSKISLNAGSTLHFPIPFGDNRHVLLTGEGYFDVTTDPTHPFTVTTRDNVQIRVLGTRFNLSAYASEPVTATLVEGQIEIVSSNKRKVITPSTQAIIKNGNDTIVTRIVANEAQYTSWAEGVFRFNDMSLQDIAHKLSRWYDVDIRFENEDAANVRFTGVISRDCSLGYILNLLEQISNVSCEARGNEIKIKYSANN
ncbi:iron dicitrate transporter FecR [Bacteroidia bacterium]|nr:iron dicitrate transporter FecR [Bacteroidia bacterium]GHV30931.1 iron dicitrate transporter FecR [Bacteroidia bacterium]